MQPNHTPRTVSASFDDPNLVSAAGLVPILTLARNAGLGSLADKWVRIPTDKGANPGRKVVSIIAGMLAGADSIDDLRVLRHGGMRKLFSHILAPSTLGSFLRSFTHGHVRQLDAVASRFLISVANSTALLRPDDAARTGGTAAGPDGYALMDLDDTIIEVHGHQKQGARNTYLKCHGLNALIATVTSPLAGPVIVGQRLRSGSANSPRGAGPFITEAIGVTRRLLPRETPILFRMDSGFYGYNSVHPVLRAGADVSVTVRSNPSIRRGIAAIPETGWAPIKYTDALYDHDTGQWVSDAEVAEFDHTAFTGQKKEHQIVGRVVVRRVKAFNTKKASGQDTLVDVYRYHAFFTTSRLDTVTADKTHREHAIIEQVNADLKNSALAHLPSGRFNANAAWLVLAVIAFNLTRASAAATGPELARATTGTIRAKLIMIAARIATSARTITLHLPKHWPWETAWMTLFRHGHRPDTGHRPVRVLTP